MAEIFRLDREIGSNSTIGKLYDPGSLFLCNTIEDVVRNVKVNDETAIPAGLYRIVMGWSPKRQRMVPFLLDVPFFTDIQIHTGNTVKDTKGCLVVGKYDPKTPDFVGGSHDTYEMLFPVIRKLCEKGETLIRINGGFEAKDWIRQVPGAVPPGI